MQIDNLSISLWEILDFIIVNKYKVIIGVLIFLFLFWLVRDFMKTQKRFNKTINGEID